MIDELVKVANAIEAAGFPTYDWHPILSALPSFDNKNPCIRIWISQDGHVKNVEHLPTELNKKLWKYEPNSGFSLPGFNYSPGNLSTIFTDTRESLEKRCNDNLNKVETLKKFLSALKAINAEDFKNEFERETRRQFGENIAEKLLGDGAKPSVFLDIVDYAESEYPVSCPETMKRLNELLWLSYVPEECQFQDAYNLKEKGLKDLYPPVTLPTLGGIKLRSQVKVIQAQARYNFCESITFPTGLETRKRVKAALEWISDNDRNGNTFGLIGDKELLFVFPNRMPAHKVPMASLFGVQSPKIEATEKEETFEHLAKTVIDLLKGSGTIAASDSELNIFSLRKMDKARTKVVCYRNITVDSLESASLDWMKGCANIPPIDLCPVDENISTVSIFPLRLNYFLNSVWQTDGSQIPYYDKKTKKPRVSLFKATDGLSLMLDKNVFDKSAGMLSHFNRNSLGYFLNLCRCTTRWKSREELQKENNERKKVIYAILAKKSVYPAVLGLLLFKLNNRKEFYMTKSAFLLGRFLRIADEIHRLYCEVIRDGQLPPELCGSALIIAMQENPGMTLDQLTKRSAPYFKWAVAFHDGKTVLQKGENEIKVLPLVKTWLKRWTETADQLSQLDWSSRLTHVQRAEVFLGYLASFPKKETTKQQTALPENAN